MTLIIGCGDKFRSYYVIAIYLNVYNWKGDGYFPKYYVIAIYIDVFDETGISFVDMMSSQYTLTFTIGRGFPSYDVIAIYLGVYDWREGNLSRSL